MLYSFLVNRYLLASLVLLLLQQIIVASSTLWITSLIAEVQKGHFSTYFFSFYLSSLLLPYVPGALAVIALTNAKLKINVDFVFSFAESYKGKINEWTSESEQAKKLSILTNEGSSSIDAFLDYLYHFFSSGLNVGLNLLFLALILEPFLLLSYFVGITFAFLILKTQSRLKKVLSIKAQNGRLKWISMLWKSWDNILLNNCYNYSIWEKKLNQRAKRLIKSNFKLDSFSQLISVLMAFALFTPTLLQVAYLPSYYSGDLVKIAILIVALPRLFQILNYSYEFLFILTEYPRQKSRLDSVSAILSNDNEINHLEKRIQWNKLKIMSEAEDLISPKKFLDSLPSSGRYTIKGENGSGKSSLALLIKQSRGDDAFYLPAKHHLTFQNMKQGLSTGQQARQILKEISEKINVSILLLDEWDANLDIFHKGQLSKEIDRLAKDRCVIEIRHN